MNDRDYPIPSYAVYAWIVGDRLAVQFPPVIGSKSHTVHFPASPKGMALLLDSLRERSRGAVTISTRGALTSYQVERTLAGDKRYNDLIRAMQAAVSTPEQIRESEDFLKELGLL